jgi:hypothetical protein
MQMYIYGVCAVIGGVVGIAVGRLLSAPKKPAPTEALSPDAVILLAAIENIYLHLAPSVPDSVECPGAAYEWRVALNTAKLAMAKFGSEAFYEGDGPPPSPESFEIAPKKRKFFYRAS